MEVDCSDGEAVGGNTLKSNPPSAACTPKKNMYQKIGGKNDATKARAHYDIIWSKFYFWQLDIINLGGKIISQ